MDDTVSDADTVHMNIGGSRPMAESSLVLQAIRAQLRTRGWTYRELAEKLGVSEPTVKRDLSKGGFSLHRLDDICAVLEVSLSQLLTDASEGGEQLTKLSETQETALVGDPKLLLVTFLAVNDWKFAEIVENFRLDENELISLLLRLDQLRIVDYRPPHRLRKLTARNFSWRRDGPVHAFFLARVVPEFFADRFEAEGDSLHFVAGTLSEASRRHVVASMTRLAQECQELAHRDARLPLPARDGVSVVLALRKWEFSEFTQLRR
jgi:transcriptional regulator with XRE-family HTH domain